MKRFHGMLALPALLLVTTIQAQPITDQKLIDKGAYLARAGDCVACHTSTGGKPFAGGYAMATPIGSVYSTNITPDKDTGIGEYSFEDFDNAVRRGIAREGHTLYPAMPYPSYARVTEEDMRALYAYFMHGVEPVHQENRASDIPWPLSMRFPLAIWRWLFAPQAADFQPVPGTDPVVARGAYLVEGLAHCGACHSPRSLTLQEKALSDDDSRQFLAGGAAAEGWVAKNLRGDARSGLGSWTEEDLVHLFKTGRSERSAVFGSMTLVVEHSTQYLSDDDITAIARYLKTLAAVDPDEKAHNFDDTIARALFSGDDSATGAALYIDNCAACHRTDGQGYSKVFPALAGNSTVMSEDPTSLIHIVLAGGTVPATRHAPSAFTMPPFAWRLSDDEVADVVSFIRASWGNDAPAVGPGQVSSLRSEVGAAEHGSQPQPAY